MLAGSSQDRLRRSIRALFARADLLHVGAIPRHLSGRLSSAMPGARRTAPEENIKEADVRSVIPAAGPSGGLPGEHPVCAFVRCFMIAGVALVTMAMGGCATVIKGEHQEISIATDPPGAACELRRNGEVLVLVSPTPGSAKITRNVGAVEVRCTKPGHLPGTEVLPSQFNAVTFGNILLGGVIGAVVDASSGANYEYAPNVYIKLPPAEFGSISQRDAYFDAWRAELLQDASRARAAIARSCTNDQCAQLEQQTEAQVSSVMARIDSGRASIPVAPGAREGGQATAGAFPGDLGRGAKWKYRILDRDRSVGTVTIEAIGVTGDRVTERITREGYGGFRAEREIYTSSAFNQFLDPMQLPGGYQLLEPAPYLIGENTDGVGKVWQGLGAEILVVNIGKQRLYLDLRLAAKETLTVPAGGFETYRYETSTSRISVPGGGFSFRAIYWYAPVVHRPVRMQLELHRTYGVSERAKDTYELLEYQSAAR